MTLQFKNLSPELKYWDIMIGEDDFLLCNSSFLV